MVRREKKLKKLLKEAEQAEDVYVIGRVNLLLSICYFDLGNRNGILSCAVKAVDVFEKLGDRNMLAGSCNMLGLAYRAQENYLRAVESYNRAFEMIRGIKRPTVRKVAIYSNIAECYYLMGAYQKSSRLLLKRIDIFREKHPDDHISAVIFAINLSDNYESQKKYDKALAVLDDVLPHAEVLDRDVFLWGYYIRRCCVLYKNGNRREGEKYADLTIESLNTGYDSYEFHRDFEKIAMQEVEVGDLDRAQKFADILNNYADKNGSTIDLIVSKRVQARLFQAVGERQKALLLYRELSELYEKRMREQHEMQYETQKNAENASKEIMKLLQRIRLSKEKAERDPLTGLMNRSSLVSITSEFFQNAKEKGKTLGAIFMDIDYFKEFNDTYGHAAGDEAIRYVASVCLSEVNPSVRFFRYGGDEYFGIVFGYSDEELEKLASRISGHVRASGLEHEKNPNGQMLTVSVGIVNVDMRESKDSILDIIQYADKTLYHAKDRGKNAAFAYHALGNSEHQFKRITVKECKVTG